MTFIIQATPNHQHGPRLGVLTCNAKLSVETPHFIALASRGIIPHLSQDILSKCTSSRLVYIALEDSPVSFTQVLESAPKLTPPILSETFRNLGFDLDRFLSAPEAQLSVLGARRVAPVLTPNSNTINSLAISTSVGFRRFPVQEYVSACQHLQPDIVIGIGDIPYGPKPGVRRIEKILSNTERWMWETVDTRRTRCSEQPEKSLPKLFAPLVPIPLQAQGSYMELLEEDLKQDIGGLAVYDAELALDLPPSLSLLPRLSLADTPSPHAVLHQVLLGIDLHSISFISAATDAGVALVFRFPRGPQDHPGNYGQCDLGVNMYDQIYEADLAPLMPDCACSTCVTHHRAYIRHLLVTNEMLAWVLLQVHNLMVTDHFFMRIRQSLQDGSFHECQRAFERAYKKCFGNNTGHGPRVRGYQVKSEGGDAKRNSLAFVKRL